MQALVVSFDFSSLGFVLTDEELGFGGVESLELPGKVGDALGENGFDLGLGVEVLVHGGAEGLILLWGFGGEEGGGLRGEAMGEGVLGGAGFALWGFGAGGFLGVGAVGGDSLFRRGQG